MLAAGLSTLLIVLFSAFLTHPVGGCLTGVSVCKYTMSSVLSSKLCSGSLNLFSKAYG